MKYLLIILFLIMSLVNVNAQDYSISYPKNNQVLSDSNLNILWDGIPNASSYHLQIATDSLFQNIILDSNNINALNINVILNNGVYFSHINALQPSLIQNSSYSKFSIFMPSSIDSLVLWLAADSGITKDVNGNILQWNDLSGNNINANQSNSQFQPVIDTIINARLSVKFNDGYLQGYFIDSVSNNNLSVFIAGGNFYSNNTIFALFNNGIYSYKFLELGLKKNSNPNIITNYLGDGSSYTDMNMNYNLENYFLLHYKLSPYNTTGTEYRLYNLGNMIYTNHKNKSLDKIGSFVVGARSKGSTPIYRMSGSINEIIMYNRPISEQESYIVNKYLKDKYTPPVNLGQNILRRYGFCDTTLSTTDMYESYLWNTGDTTRAISISKEDAGWYWCEVPNLYGEIMRDSVYVYDLLPKQDFQDTIICYGDTLNLTSAFTSASASASTSSSTYSHLWQDLTTGDTLSTSSNLSFSPSPPRTLSCSYRVTDSLGCFRIDTFNLALDSFPIMASLGVDKSLCTGDKIGLVSGQAKADSFLWSTGSTDSLLVINTAGTYSLIVSDTINCIAKDTIYVDIHGVTPLVNFYADTVCLRDSSIFIDQSQSLDQSNLISWKYEFGDDSLALKLSSSPVPHLYADSGTYTTKLTVSTDSNCSNYTYKNIYIRPLPQPNFYPLTGCQNIGIVFNNLTIHKDSLTSFFWDFGNGDTEQQTTNNKQQTYTYNQPGQYNTSLTATDIHGCTDSITQQVNINPSPFANFNYSTSCEGTPISFIDISTTLPYNSIQSWKWTFDSLVLSYSSSPANLFDSAGFYPVSLKVISLNNCYDSISKTVQLHSIPKANFSTDTACMNNVFNLNNLSTIINDTINKFYWFSDGQGFDTLSNTKYRYNDTLSHQILLRVKTNALCEDSIIKTIKSHPIPNADFTTDKEYGLPPLTVVFTNISTNNKQQTTNNLSYNWSFGDGSQSTIKSPTHTYIDSAIFYPQLKATNQFGCWDTVSYPIYAVYAAIDVAITSIRAEVNNGYISYSCTITNYGKQKLKELNLFAKYNSGVEISEKWVGELFSGESIVYNFNSKTQVNNNEQIRYYCIRVDLAEDATQKDENPSNNSLCKDLSSDFWLSSIYPNPVNDKIQFDVVLPYSEDINIQISNAQGSIIQKYKRKASKGLNQMSINLPTLKSGQYYLKLEYKDGSEVRAFIVL